MVPLLICGAVFLLLALLLLAPVKLEVSFRGEFTAQVNYLFLPVSLGAGKGAFSSGGGFGVRGGSAAQPQSADKAAGASTPSGIARFFAVPARAGSGSKRRFCQFTETSTPEKAEHSEIARKRGRRVRGYSVRPNLRSSVWRLRDFAGLLPCRNNAVSVDLDYQAEEHHIDFSAAVTIRLLFFVVEGLILLYRALPFFKKLQAAQDHMERISQTRKQGESK